MSVKKSCLLSGVLVILGSLPSAKAQEFQPFIEPGYFDHDLQFFAPADDLDAWGEETLATTGWFASYARSFLKMSRPNRNQFVGTYALPVDSFTTIPANAATGTVVAFGGGTATGPGQFTDSTFDLFDTSWGNRIDLGYMTDNDNGWLFSYFRMSGPSTGSAVHQQRINRLNEDDEGVVPGSSAAPTVIEPPSDRNTVGPPNRERFYDVTNSLNDGTLLNLEANKVWRMVPLYHGAILEPFVGVRYCSFGDITQRQTYMSQLQQFTTNANPVVIVPAQPPVNGPGGITGGIPAVTAPAPPGVTAMEGLLTDRYLFDNEMFGGQIGFRYYRRVSRWNLSTDFRAFGMQNFQHLSRTYSREYTFYDGATQNSAVTNIVPKQDVADWNATSTVLGTDIRAEAAFEITRDVKLMAGMQFMGFFTGIGRGPFIDQNHGNMVLVGGTVGFEVNR